MTHAIFFYLLAALALVSGVLVVANPFSRNPATSAMFLVALMVSLSGLFVLLQAFFLAAVQVLIYAGAVMVLFLFVIMLLDLKEEQRRRFKRFALISGAVAVCLLAGLLMACIIGTASVQAGPVHPGDARTLGLVLLLKYVLPFEILSVLLVVAMVGVVILGRREEA